MSVNSAPTAVAGNQWNSRKQEFERALDRYMESYREAQLGTRRLPAGRRLLIGFLALTEREPVGSRA